MQTVWVSPLVKPLWKSWFFYKGGNLCSRTTKDFHAAFFNLNEPAELIRTLKPELAFCLNFPFSSAPKLYNSLPLILYYSQIKRKGKEYWSFVKENVTSSGWKMMRFLHIEIFSRVVLVRNLGGKTDFFKEKKRHLDKSSILKLL